MIAANKLTCLKDAVYFVCPGHLISITPIRKPIVTPARWAIYAVFFEYISLYLWIILGFDRMRVVLELYKYCISVVRVDQLIPNNFCDELAE